MNALMSGVGRLAKLPSHRGGKWVILGFWVIAMALLGSLGAKLGDVEDNQARTWLPGDAESTKALEIAERFHSIDEVPAIVVYENPNGLSGADLNAIADDARKFADVDLVEGEVVGPITSDEKPHPTAAQVVVPLEAGGDGWFDLPDVVDDIKKITDDDGDYTTYVTGPAGIGADQADAFAGIDGTLLYSALAVVIVILLFTYRSPILWVLPVVSAAVALSTAQGVIYLLAKYADLTVNAQSSGILTVLVFGAGTDYALLLVARYREELRRHENRHEAMAFALHRAGPAIWASAATVILGMICLSFADLNSTAGLGPVAAIGVGVGLLAMVSLLPALLVIFGRWMFWPVRPTFGSADHTETGLWAKVGGRIARAPRVTWVTTSLLLGALALTSLTLEAHGLTNAGTFTDTPDSVVGEQVLAKHFPAGSAQPVEVIANADSTDEVRDVLAGVPGIVPDSVTDPEIKDGYAYLEATLSDPPDGPAAEATVLRVRDAIHAVEGADAMAGGQSAIIHDINQANAHDRNLIIPIVLIVVFAILAMLLRTVIAPLILVATVVLSFFAALGISAFFFNHVFDFEGADASFPLFVFVFLVSLGIDYNIFLMTRVHEEAKKQGTRKGALIGLSATGGVITSAGLVLAGTFAALGTLPVTFTAELGFAVAVGVLIDTIIVRAVLVTALTLDLGRWMWWPHKLFHKHDPVTGELSETQPAAALRSQR
jgi:RND superfamily putative drug exporter